jgi:hypothetical protein
MPGWVRNDKNSWTVTGSICLRNTNFFFLKRAAIGETYEYVYMMFISFATDIINSKLRNGSVNLTC